ncbi:hypothetical protein PLANPX_2042 [Lacipirellula parvula]|uniref:Uncharacterized protein n=1 Tax=Lacipirellula parvula TaxID=2650471 RepID=A0A5K7X756_9BACT|nr:hypothetical protein PLANPX_2042 [Lacipirellula parvula]
MSGPRLFYRPAASPRQGTRPRDPLARGGSGCAECAAIRSPKNPPLDVFTHKME